MARTAAWVRSETSSLRMMRSTWTLAAPLLMGRECTPAYRKWARSLNKGIRLQVSGFRFAVRTNLKPERGSAEWSGYKERQLVVGERKLNMNNGPGSNNETVFTMEATPLKYGPGASEEAGWELKRMGVGRVMLVSDPGIVKADITGRIVELVEAEGIEVEVWTARAWSPRTTRFRRRRISPPREASTGSWPSAAGRASTPPRSPTS